MTLSVALFSRATICSHSVRSGSGTSRCSSRQTTEEKFDFSSIKGASYRQGIVMFSMTQSGLTLQNIEIFWKMDGSSGSSQRRTMMLGLMPMPSSSLTECCVGFDLCSSEPRKNGTSVTWIKRLFSRPTSREICRTASIKGCDSMSPMVPPISVMTTSAFVFLPTRYTKSLISFVMWGMTCTVEPRYSPRRSLFRTFQ